MKSILIVDDDAAMCRLLVDYLSEYSFLVSAVPDSKQMLICFAKEVPDLVVVDLDLRREDGLEIVRRLGTTSDVPVIIISGCRRDEADKVVGLELGAIDYIPKPFGLREMLARVRAALRERPEREPDRKRQRGYTFGPWKVHLRHRQVWSSSGVEVKLTASEFNLLAAFLKAPRQVLSREQLLAASRVHDQEVCDRSIDVLILRLRRKLEEDPSNPRYLKTERGAGYILDCEVALLEP